MGASKLEAVRPNAEYEQQATGSASAPYYRPLTVVLLLLGVALRAWAYFRVTPLYLDEILLSRNILDLPLRHLLTKPLLLDQVAPRGFLLFERSAILVFGSNELALRLFPFICGIAGLLFFWRLAGRVLSKA